MGRIEELEPAGDLDTNADNVRSGAASERMAAAWKPGARGDEGVRRLMPLLLEGELEERWRAAMGLTRAGKKAVDPLISALSHERPETRSAAAWALQEIGDRKAAVKPLIKRSKTPRTRAGGWRRPARTGSPTRRGSGPSKKPLKKRARKPEGIPGCLRGVPEGPPAPVFILPPAPQSD